MKTALLTLLFFAGAAHAAECPDLTGRYAWVGGPDDTGVVVTIQQASCATATAVYDHADGLSFTRPMVLDGSLHPTFRQGDVVTWESFTWQGAVLILQREDRWPAAAHFGPLRYRGKIYLDAGRNLIEETDTLTDDGSAVWAHDVEKYRRR